VFVWCNSLSARVVGCDEYGLIILGYWDYAHIVCCQFGKDLLVLIISGMLTSSDNARFSCAPDAATTTIVIYMRRRMVRIHAKPESCRQQHTSAVIAVN
jgi:hypothetical protein